LTGEIKYNVQCEYISPRSNHLLFWL